MPSSARVRRFGKLLIAADASSAESAPSDVSTPSSTTPSLSTIQSSSCVAATVRRRPGPRSREWGRRTPAIGGQIGWVNVDVTVAQDGGTSLRQNEVQRPLAILRRRHDLQTTLASVRRSDVGSCSRIAPRHCVSIASKAPVPSRSLPSSMTALGGGAWRAAAASRSSRVTGSLFFALAKIRSSSSARDTWRSRAPAGPGVLLSACGAAAGSSSSMSMSSAGGAAKPSAGAAARRGRDVRAFLAIMRCWIGRGCCEH